MILKWYHESSQDNSTRKGLKSGILNERSNIRYYPMKIKTWEIDLSYKE